MKTTYDVIIVGGGAAGLFAALHLPTDWQILCITKGDLESSDSYLAQGGICVLHDPDDYDSFMEDTMRAGHYENRRDSVDMMIRSSTEAVEELIAYGVDFNRKDGELDYTREGAHSKPRILYHKDITGKEITDTLLKQVRKLPNVTLMEYTCMSDILVKDNCCYGIVAMLQDGTYTAIKAGYTIWACGGIGGLFENSTNFPLLTGDAIAIGLRHRVAMEHLDYIQIHPTTLYSTRPGRRFLISESVRGEGALLYDAQGSRFTNELLPRDLLTQEIWRQMKKDGTGHVWLDMRPLGEGVIRSHFPNICSKCLEEGYDVFSECIPVVPAQHYFMGGVKVDLESRTSMKRLYAAGETSCNGVHGANRLASNSLLETIVFAKRAAADMTSKGKIQCADLEREQEWINAINLHNFQDAGERETTYKMNVLDEIERMRKSHE